MNWTEVREYLRRQLRGEPEREKDSLFLLIYEHLTGETRGTFITDPDRLLSAEQENRFRLITERLTRNEPLQYILGTACFFGRDFRVDPAVLIPRPETEELIHQAFAEVRSPSGRCLDIGTGCGCLAITWAAERPNWQIHAWDISEEALEVARTNAEHIAPQAPVEFRKADMLKPPAIDEPYDVILSNPPYVRHLEREQMHPRVIGHEPPLALWVPDDDPLRFCKAIAGIAKQGLRPDGHLFVEINQYLARETEALFRSAGFSRVHLKHDLSGNPRLMHIRK